MVVFAVELEKKKKLVSKACWDIARVPRVAV